MSVRKQISTVMATIDQLEKPKQLERIIARAEKRIELLEAEEWEMQSRPNRLGRAITHSNTFAVGKKTADVL